MMTIYKYHLEIDINNIQEIKMPAKAKILRFDLEHKKPVVSALIETDAVEVTRFIEMFQTGQEISYSKHKRVYLSSFMLANEIVRIHVFELLI